MTTQLRLWKANSGTHYEMRSVNLIRQHQSFVQFFATMKEASDGHENTGPSPLR